MKNIVLIVGGVVVLGGFLFWAGQAQNPSLVFVAGTNVACLPNGHANIATHIHPELSIVVDGEPEVIPADIGITSTCMPEIHTHDTSGAVHVETTTHARLQELTFADFFDVWGQPAEREGYNLTILFNGETAESITEVPLEDHSQIQLIYTSAS